MKPQKERAAESGFSAQYGKGGMTSKPRSVLPGFVDEQLIFHKHKE
jgi:hypothetical protein